MVKPSNHVEINGKMSNPININKRFATVVCDGYLNPKITKHITQIE